MHDRGAVVRLTDHLSDPRPQQAKRPDLGDRHELVVVGSQPETDLRQGLGHREAGLGEHPQVGHRGSDAAGELPRRVGAQIVERGPVDGDRPHPVAAGHLLGDVDDFPDAGAGRSLSDAVSGSAPRSIDNVARWSASTSATNSSRASQAAVVGAGIEDHRRHAQIDAVEHLLQLRRRHTGLPHPDQQRADSLGQPGEHRGIDFLGGNPGYPGGRNRLGDLPPGLDVSQRVATAQVGPLARQRRLRQLVEGGVERADREALVGRAVQQPVGLRPQLVGVPPRALGQHPGHRRAPSDATLGRVGGPSGHID